MECDSRGVRKIGKGLIYVDTMSACCKILLLPGNLLSLAVFSSNWLPRCVIARESMQYLLD